MTPQIERNIETLRVAVESGDYVQIKHSLYDGENRYCIAGLVGLVFRGNPHKYFGRKYLIDDGVDMKFMDFIRANNRGVDWVTLVDCLKREVSPRELEA